MDYQARLAGYARQRGVALEKDDDPEYEYDPREKLTGPQRRRLDRKVGVHVHEKGVRCIRCRPAGAADGVIRDEVARFIGGQGPRDWRQLPAVQRLRRSGKTQRASFGGWPVQVIKNKTLG
jgi:hypothetical protein